MSAEPYLEGVHDGLMMALSWMSGRRMADPTLHLTYEALRHFIQGVDPWTPESAAPAGGER